MKTKLLNKDLFFTTILVLFNFFYRFFVWKDNIYYENIDSYYFLQFGKQLQNPVDVLSFMTYYFDPMIVELILILTILLIPVLFYYTVKSITNSNNAFITSIIFSCSLLVYINTKFGMIDKNIFSMFFILLIIYVFLNYKGFNKYLYALLLLWVFTFVWRGAMILFMILLFYNIIHSLLRKQYIFCVFYGFIAGLAYILLIHNVFIKLWESKNFILETQAIVVFELIIFIGVLIYTILMIKNQKIYPIKLLFVVIGFFVSCIGYLIFFRFNIYLVCFGYILLGVIMHNKKYTVQYFLSFAVIFFIILYPYYFQDTVMNNDIENVMHYVNDQDTNCLISEWGYGHIYQYYTNKTVLYKGHANLNQIDYLALGKETNCSIIWKYDDIQILEYMINQTGKNISRPYYIELQKNINFGDMNVIEN